MDAHIQPLPFDPASLNGLSAKLMVSHHQNNYAGAEQDDVERAVVIDVRRAGIYQQADTMIPGARWRDPAAVAAWFSELPADRDVIVYCVHGDEVGRATALRLRAAGLNARYLRGGIDGWQASGRSLMSRIEEGVAP